MAKDYLAKRAVMLSSKTLEFWYLEQTSLLNHYFVYVD